MTGSKNGRRVSPATIILAMTLVAGLGTSGCTQEKDGSFFNGKSRNLVATDAPETMATEEADDSPLAHSCGYETNTGFYTQWPGGFQAWIEVANVSGLSASSFSLLVDIGDAEIIDGYEATYEQTEGGYLISEPSWLQWNPIAPGGTHRFGFIGSGDPGEFEIYVLSINGQTCDKAPPVVQLTANQKLFTDNGMLTLTAAATDNVAVRKVIFSQDGVVIGEDTEAPFTAEVDISDTLNGRQHFTATAIDPTGNTGEDTASVFVAIGTPFIGAAVTDSADMEMMPELFNQVTPANAGKWGSVESERDIMVWDDLDTSYQFAKNNGHQFRLHTLFWGSQQPAWLEGLTAEEQLAEIHQWLAALAERYPDVEMIDVVNEPLHSTPVYAEALGGAGETGWDWVVNAFALAREYFPKAELHLNDFSVLALEAWATDYLEVIDVLMASELIDGIGVQGHFLERADLPNIVGSLELLAATELPIYVTELDISFADDARHANRVRDLATTLLSNPSVVGITHWGLVEDNTWRPDAHLITANGDNRPAQDWLECYFTGQAPCEVSAYTPPGWKGGQYGLTLEAEEFDTGEGTLVLGNIVGYTDPGDWIAFSAVEFKDVWDTFSVTYAKDSGDTGSISIHAGSLDAVPTLVVPLPPTGGWGNYDTIDVEWPVMNSTEDIYIQFNDTYGIANLDSVRFGREVPDPNANLVVNGDFETDNLSGWSSWTGASLSVSAEQVAGGSQSLKVETGASGAYAVYSLTGLVSPDTEYQVSVQAMHLADAPDTLRLAAKIECVDPPEGHNTYPWLKNVTEVEPGVWTLMDATLPIPACEISDVAIYFEGLSSEAVVHLDAMKVAPPDNNLVINPSFENPTLDGWSSWSGATLSVSDAAASDGNQSLLAERGAEGSYAVYQLTDKVYPAFAYNVSVQAMHLGDAPDTLRLAAKVECADPPDGHNTYQWLQNATDVAPGVWTTLSGILIIPDCAINDVRIYFEGTSTDVDVHLDAVSVSPPGDNLVNDGSFENGTAGWSSWSGATLSTSGAHVFAGSQSMLVSRGAEGAYAVYGLTGVVQPGNSYAVSAQALHLGADADTLRLSAKVECTDPPEGHNTYQWLNSINDVTPVTWTELSGTSTIPNCDISDVAIYFEGTSADVNVHIDAVQIYAN